MIFLFSSNGLNIKVALLAIVYIINFLFISQIWPLALASIKLISGLMVVVILWASITTQKTRSEIPKNSTAFLIFRFMVAIFILITIAVSINELNAWLPIPYANMFVGLVFFIGGFLYLGLDPDFSSIFIGLLMLLAGFDILYSSLEGSALVTGLYAAIVILISTVYSYLNAESVKDNQI